MLPIIAYMCVFAKLVTERGQGKRATFQVCEKRTIAGSKAMEHWTFHTQFWCGCSRKSTCATLCKRISLCMWLECTKRNSLYDEQRAIHNRYISLGFFPFFTFYLVFLSQFTVVGDSVVAFYRLFVSSNSPQIRLFFTSLFVVFSALFLLNARHSTCTFLLDCKRYGIKTVVCRRILIYME